MKKCPACKRILLLEYFNSQKKYCLSCHKEKGKIWRQNNKEKDSESQKKYKEKWIVSEGYESYQKQYQRDYHVLHRDDEQYRERKRKNKAALLLRTRTIIYNHLSTHPCVDCGEKEIVKLSFDHVRGKKEFNISDALRRNYSVEKLEFEIDKCDIRCHNCHFTKTAYQINSWKVNFVL